MKLITMHLISLILISVGTTTVAFVPLAAPYSSPVESIVRKVAPRAVSDLQSSSLFAFVHASANDDEEPKGRFSAVRATMRKSTGISLTAIRATMRAATGVSLTAMYLSVFGFTSQWVRESMKFVLSIFPPSVSRLIRITLNKNMTYFSLCAYFIVSIFPAAVSRLILRSSLHVEDLDFAPAKTRAPRYDVSSS